MAKKSNVKKYRALLEECQKELQQEKKHMNNQTNPSKYKKTLKSIGLVVSISLNAFFSYLTFYPHIILSVGPAVSPHKPWANPFILDNNNPFEISNVRFSFTPLYVKIENSTTLISPRETYLYDSRPIIIKLKAFEKASIKLPPDFNLNSVKDADIIINIHYKILFLEKIQRTRFETDKDNN